MNIKLSKKKLVVMGLALAIGAGVLTGCNDDAKPEDQETAVENVEDVEEDETQDEVVEVLEDEFTIEQQLAAPKAGDKVATIKTNKGDIKVKLLPEVAPKAVENFESLAKDGKYNGTKFHRVIEDFMIQSGSTDKEGMESESKWGEPFEDEFSMGARNFRGALAMANQNIPKTNGSQFFIVQQKEISDVIKEQFKELQDAGYPEEVAKKYEELGGSPFLDFKHTVFGQVYEGMEVVDNIAKVETDETDRPKEDIVVESIEVVELGKENKTKKEDKIDDKTQINKKTKADKKTEEKTQNIVDTNDVPKEYTSALRSADIYGNELNLSKSGIYKQLTSNYDKFSEEAAKYAIENIKVNYKDNALKNAIIYQDDLHMSPEAIRDQLTSKHGDGFTEEEADYAIQNLPK